METLFFYLLKVCIFSAVLFGYYFLALRDKTYHHYNRFYLLGSMAISIILPLIKVEDFTMEVNPEIYQFLETVQFQTETEKPLFYWLPVTILLVVSLVLMMNFISGIIKIQRLKKSFQGETFQKLTFYRTNLHNAPFSYFKNLFWKDSIELKSDLGKQILKHEMVHIEQNHTLDKLIVEVFTALFWFNPFFHLIKKEIGLLHEYLADNKAVEKKDTKAFAQMLLASHFSGAAIPGASSFFNSNLKKRLQMLQKPNTKSGYAARILALPLVFTVAFAYLVNAKNKEIKATNLVISEMVKVIENDTIPLSKKEERQIRKEQAKAEQEMKKAEAEMKTAEIEMKKAEIEMQKAFSEQQKAQEEQLAAEKSQHQVAKAKIEAEKAKNEYEKFYNEAEVKRQEAALKRKEAELEMQKSIEEARLKTNFRKTFPESRNYDKNPLTENEIALLKKDAKSIEDLAKESRNNIGKNSVGFFRVDVVENKVYDLDGRQLKNETSKFNSGKSEMLGITVDAPELYVNGLKVTKEEFLKYKVSDENFKNSDAPSNVKILKIDRIGNAQRSYARRMEIITKN